MSGRTFWPAVLGGLVLSAIAAIGFEGLRPILGTATAARAIVTGIGLPWLIALLGDRNARVGRIVGVCAGLALTGVLVVVDPPLWLWMLAFTGLCWLVRCLYGCDTLRAAVADGLVTGLAACAGIAAARHTNSVFLACWTFFLVQTLVTLIPRTAPAGGSAPDPSTSDDFDRAARAAEEAVRRLSLPSTGDLP